MRSIVTLLLVILLAAAGCANCNTSPPSSPDASTVDSSVDSGTDVDAGTDTDAGPDDDAGNDAGTTADAGQPVPRQSVFQSSGGGNSSSSSYRMQWSIGAPQPAGQAASANQRITTGPAAARP